MNARRSLLRSRELFTVVLVLLASAGCETLDVQQHSVQAPSTYSLSRNVEGVSVGIDPIIALAEVRKYFGADLHKANVLPVFVVVSNHNPSASCLISSESFSVANGKFEAAGGQVDRARFAADMAAAFLVGGLYGMFLADALEETDHSLVDQNLRHLALRKKTLSPGSKADGFVFFPMPKPKERQAEWLIFFRPNLLGQPTNAAAAFSFKWTSP